VISRIISPSTVNNPTAEDYQKPHRRRHWRIKVCYVQPKSWRIMHSLFTDYGKVIKTHAYHRMTKSSWWSRGTYSGAKIHSHTIDCCQGFETNQERATHKEGSRSITELSTSGHYGYEEYGIFTKSGQSFRFAAARAERGRKKKGREMTHSRVSLKPINM